MPLVTIADAAAIPVGHGRLVEHEGTTFAVFNAGSGRFYACGAVCPHEDGPLADGWLEGDAVVCPWHGFDYDASSGRCLVDLDLAIPVYPARLVGTAVEVQLP
jgi:nitrite reductase/ring-hydroxylating ferredoxin subunit